MSSHTAFSESIIMQARPQTYDEYVSYEYDETALFPEEKYPKFYSDEDDDEEKYPFKYMRLTGPEIWNFWQRQGSNIGRVAEYNPYLLPPELTDVLYSGLPRDCYNLLPDMTPSPSLITTDTSEFGKLIDYTRDELQLENDES